MGAKNRGRPNRQKQIQIERTLRPYFERNYSATFTSKITNFDIKTVCKYFGEFGDQIREVEYKDFVEREKTERERIRLGFDNILFEQYKLLEDVKNEVTKFKKENKPIPRYLISSQMEILRTISSLTETKGSFGLQMSLDESIEKKIEEKIKDHINKPDH